MAAIGRAIRIVVAGLALTGSAGVSLAASEADCAAIGDRRARLRCTDEFAIALGSRAKVAVRRLLRNPDSAVFSAFRLVPGTSGDALCGRVDVEAPGGRMSGPQDFAFDDGTAYVLLKDATRDGAGNTSQDDRIAALGRNIDRFIVLCGPSLPTMNR